VIRYAPTADISTDQAQLLVNTVNTVGVMGAGVAKAVRLRYPDIMTPYQAACTNPDPRRRLDPGTLHLYTAPDGRLVVNMATKRDWRDPSEYDWVGAGLVYLNRLLCEKRTDIRSVLLPPPGCGHGGLDWADVNRMVRTYLRPAAERGVEIRVSAEEPDPVTGPVRFAGVGSRETPEPVLALMREVGALLAQSGWILRTGEAVGADSAFREGAEAAGHPGEIFTIKPRPDIAGSIFDLRPVHLRMLNSVHPKPEALSPVGRKLMARNGSQVFGTDFREPSDLVVCWTVGGKGGGGTGQAIRLARSVGIPVLDLGRPEHEGMRAGDIVARARDLVEAHRAACGVPMPPPDPVLDTPSP
jgi:O-acetyl-ADP-ribose deacetylase (regulator of RNase III)